MPCRLPQAVSLSWNVLPMQAKKFAVITTGSEVFKGRIEDKFTPILVGKLAEYGCEYDLSQGLRRRPGGHHDRHSGSERSGL